MALFSPIPTPVADESITRGALFHVRETCTYMGVSIQDSPIIREVAFIKREIITLYTAEYGLTRAFLWFLFNSRSGLIFFNLLAVLTYSYFFANIIYRNEQWRVFVSSAADF